MAGRFKTRRYLFATLLILSASECASSRAEEVHGESRDLGITFVVEGGAKWCRPDIVVKLSSGSADVFQPDAIPFLQMIGRIEAVVISQCPAIEKISFDGFVDSDRRVFAAEASRLTRWRRFIGLEPETRRPICQSSESMNCASKIDAYAMVHALMRGAGFADVAVTALLQPDDSDLSFRFKDVVGKVRITPSDEIPPELAAADKFARAIAESIAEGCRADTGIADSIVQKAHGADLAEAELSCTQANKKKAKNIVIVSKSNDKFRVLSFWAENPGQGQARTIVDRTIAAIKVAK
jgi:hypothetical protein